MVGLSMVITRNQNQNKHTHTSVAKEMGKSRKAAERAEWLHVGELVASLWVQVKGYGNLQSRC
jgi:hypothetical protein